MSSDIQYIPEGATGAYKHALLQQDASAAFLWGVMQERLNEGLGS